MSSPTNDKEVHFSVSTLQSSLSSMTSRSKAMDKKVSNNPADLAEEEEEGIPYSRPGTPKVAHDRMAFVGLGNMGQPMAYNLAKFLTDHEMPALTIYNRSSDRIDLFTALVDAEFARAQTLEEDQGIQPGQGGVRKVEFRVCQDLEEIGASCDIIITSLSSDDAAKEVYAALFAGQEKREGKGDGIFPDGGEGKSTIFVDTSTVYPHTSGKLERLASHGTHRHFISAPVFGTPPIAKAAGLVIAMSGSYWAKKHISHLLVPAVGKKIIDLGNNVERAMSFKLVGNTMELGIMELAAETITLADQSGVGSENLYALFEAMYPAPTILGYARKMIDNDFKGERGFTLQGGIQDAGNIRRLAEECSVPLPIIDVAHQHLIAAKANGGDQLDWSSLVGGQRISAGLAPFSSKTRLEKYEG